MPSYLASQLKTVPLDQIWSIRSTVLSCDPKYPQRAAHKYCIITILMLSSNEQFASKLSKLTHLIFYYREMIKGLHLKSLVFGDAWILNRFIYSFFKVNATQRYLTKLMVLKKCFANVYRQNLHSGQYSDYHKKSFSSSFAKNLQNWIYSNACTLEVYEVSNSGRNVYCQRKFVLSELQSGLNCPNNGEATLTAYTSGIILACMFAPFYIRLRIGSSVEIVNLWKLYGITNVTKCCDKIVPNTSIFC